MRSARRGFIRVVQGKTDEELWIPEHRELTAELASCAMRGPEHWGSREPDPSAWESNRDPSQEGGPRSLSDRALCHSWPARERGQASMASLAEPARLLTPPQIATEADDGLLTASEIAQLKLNADWVVSQPIRCAGKPCPAWHGRSSMRARLVLGG